MINANIMFLDFETSGLFPNIHAPLTLSCAFNREPVRTFKMRPHSGAQIEQAALEANGIRPEELRAFPDPAVTYNEFVAYLKERNITKSSRCLFVAYNAHFDEGFMRAWCKRNADQYRFTNSFYWPVICVGQLTALHHVDAGLPNFRLGTVYKHVYGRELANAHTSAADVEATRQLFYDHAP